MGAPAAATSAVARRASHQLQHQRLWEGAWQNQGAGGGRRWRSEQQLPPTTATYRLRLRGQQGTLLLLVLR